MLTITLAHKEWRKIKPRIIEEYGEKIFLISWVLKRELGFTVRFHTNYSKTYAAEHKSLGLTDVRLDFDDLAMVTFFRMKYL